MKIALIGRFDEGEIVAGPERVGRELFYQIKKINAEIIFIEYFFSGYKDSSILKKLFGKKTINCESIIRLGIFPLILFLMKQKFEIIHIVNLQRFILILFLLKPFIKSKISATLHGFLKFEVSQNNFWTKRYFIDLWVEKLTIKKSELIIFPSHLLCETFNSHYQISEHKYRIIPNGISEIFSSQDRRYPRINDSLKIVFYNGLANSFSRRLDELVELLKHAKYRIELFIIGKKEKAVSANNLELNYSELKSQQELINFLVDKHFVIKSGVFDTFSIFIAECMTCGLIPIINQNVGIKDFIQHNFNGFIYDGLSSTDLPKLMEEIFEGKYDLETISAHAKKIYETLSWNLIAKRYYESFESLMK
jgi:glycosyltransferase involved in cell wall biosynthesis